MGGLADLTGTTLGRYKMISLIGRGGMATVYKARDAGLDRVVAVKLLHPHLSADSSFVARFRREARVVASLRHPNIVRVFDFDSVDGEYFMVMEFVDGPTLAALLKRLARRRQKLSPEEVERIFTPLCSAIDYADQQGLVHRDIKPANIILTRTGEPVITDYGIAKIAGATSYTLPGTVIGSAQYMSPEQAQGLLSDGRSDIYSLGICLFEALTGRVPYDGETTGTILAQHVNAAVPSARALNPELSEAVDALIARVLAKDPAQRYQHAAELARDLTEALGPVLGQPPATVVADAAPQDPAPAEAPPTEAALLTTAPDVAAATVLVAEPLVPGQETTKSDPEVDGGAVSRRGGRSGPPRRTVVVLAAAALLLVAGIVAAVALLRSGPSGTSSTTAAASISAPTAPLGSAVTSGPGSSVSSTTVADPGSGASAAADALLHEGRFQEAAAALNARLAQSPGDNGTRLRLAAVYLLIPGGALLAQTQSQMVVEAEPGNVTAHALLGKARLEGVVESDPGALPGAERELREALRLDPQSALSHAFLGELYARQDKKDEGLAEAGRAVEIGPEEFWAQASLGGVRGLRGEWPEAVDALQEAVRLQPHYAVLHLLLAEALTRAGRHGEAREHVQTAMGLDQGWADSARTRSVLAELDASGG